MNVIFKKLFATELTHNYYSERMAGDFEIIPSPGCRTLLNNYGLLFRTTNNGFAVLYMSTGSTANTPAKKLNSNIKFTVYLKLKNKLLTNFTNIPFGTGTKNIFYFANTNNNIQNSLHLLSSGTGDKYVSVNDQIILKPQSFIYTQDYAGSTAAITLTDQNDNEIMNDSIDVISGSIKYYVDLTGYAAGRYKLKVDGAMKLDFFADDTACRENIFGIIELFNHSSVPPDYMFTDASGNITEQKYSINLDSRKTFWKYFIVLKYRDSVNPSDLNLIYPGAVNSFARQATVVLSDGTHAVPFVSALEIPFKEKGIKGIKLEKTNGSGARLFEIDNLPNASAEHISPEISSGKVYSEIFIYI